MHKLKEGQPSYFLYLKQKKMTLTDKLNILKIEYKNMKAYKSKCNKVDSILDYSSLDFDREGFLLFKIKQTENEIKIT